MREFELFRMPVRRMLVWDLLRDTDSYYLNHHFILADFTRAERLRGSFEASGRRKPSYVAIVLYAISKVLPRHPRFNSYLRVLPGNTRLTVYRDIDIAFTMEKVENRRRLLTLGMLRNCASRCFEDLLSEFERIKTTPLSELPDTRRLELFRLLPDFLRLAAYRLFVKPFPSLMQHVVGTVAFTSVGKHGVDFTAPLSPKSLTVSLGAVKPRPMAQGDGRVDSRLSAYLTLTYDHRIADGSDCARLANDLRKFIEIAEFI